MLQKIYLMVFERYIPELKKYDSFSFLHQPMASGQPLKIVQRHMAHPVLRIVYQQNNFLSPISSRLLPQYLRINLNKKFLRRPKTITA